MMELTADAQRMLDDYLRRADTHLRGASVSDAEEVARELRDHVERELANAPRPVTTRDMEAVLERLGNPADLVPEEDLSWWRRAAKRWSTSPEDWRLAYLSIGIFSLGLLLLGTAGGGLAILGSFFVSRAALAVAEDEQDLGGKKWLLYPGLLIVYVPLAILLLGWPAITLLSTFVARPSDIRDRLVVMGDVHAFYLNLVGLGLFLLYWLALYAIAVHWPKAFPTVFRPFLKSSGSRIIAWAFFLSLAVLVGVCSTAAA